MVILLRATAIENYNAYTSYGWGSYWGYGWGGYYPWVGGTVVYSYTTGTLLIDMIDVGNIDVDNETYPSAWGAGINGLLEGSSTDTRNRLSTSISQAFVQSPYIGVPQE